ncbi:SIS domain-containing protein [Paenibacillus sp. P26]|nr:SIS domain-containing protein [Paenibacillus sp. P26]UUZ95183.1 SIS domain-containing protein [Paenibacillus sp. P25]
MTMTMFDYIKEQAVVLPQILAQREEIGAEFLQAYDPEQVRRILFVASGSSYNEALACRYYMEKRLKKEVQVKAPFMFVNYETIFEPATLVIGISQSGRSTAVLEALRKARAQGFATAAVTTIPDSEITRAADHTILVRCGTERVDYVTLGYTSTVLTLMLMALEAARAVKEIDKAEYDRQVAAIAETLAAYDRNIADADRWVERNKADLLRAERMMIVGYGPNVGTAMEGCLKISETFRCAVSAYELEEFMHGPHIELNGRSCVFFIASEGAGRRESAGRGIL